MTSDAAPLCSPQHNLNCAVWVSPGTVPRQVASPNAHTLAADDVVSCCLDLSVPSISFRINGHPVQGMFENFNVDGLFFPVLSFSAGVKQVSLRFSFSVLLVLCLLV